MGIARLTANEKMKTDISKTLKDISHSKWYWFAYIIIGFNLMASALYFQYFLDEPPCVSCIHIRLWISLLVIVAIVALFVSDNKIMNLFANLSTLLIAVAFIERSYFSLGVERGFIFSDCGFSLGLPTWFAIEQWLPWLYRVETPCGYTPELLFGITMAEMLVLMSVVFLLVSFVVFIASLMNLKSSD